MCEILVGTIRTASRICDFFEEVEYVGLILPNGWFGRPHDNFLRLTEIGASREALHLQLEEHLNFDFEGEVAAVREEQGLSLSGFAALGWNWTEFGSPEPPPHHHTTFASGAVVLAVPV